MLTDSQIKSLSSVELSKFIDAGVVSWGDIGVAEMGTSCAYSDPYGLFEALAAAENQTDAETESVDSYYSEDDDVEEWKTPNLTLRKGIWENFPVTLVAISDGDGTDRYAVSWHKKNLEKWAIERTHSSDERRNYQEYCEWRLMHALNEYAHKYRVEPARDASMICVIAMVHGAAAPVQDAPAPVQVAAPVQDAPAPVQVAAPVAAPAPVQVAPAPAPVPAPASAPATGPVLVRLNDIKANFPVVWHETPSRTGAKLYCLELFGKKINELAASTGRDAASLTEDIRARMMTALRASNSWRVLRAEGPREVCRLEMAHR